MATWPSTLPTPSFGGYALDPVDPVIRSDMESGSPRTRRRTRARNDKINVSWLLTDREMAAFRAWFDWSDGAAGGAAWFNITLAYGDQGLRSREAKFASIFKANLAAGMLWSVSATLEIRGGDLTVDAILGAVLGLVSSSGVYPSLVLDFAGQQALDNRITFTRASVGTYFDAEGVLRTAADDVPRFDHDPLTGESLGLLVEQACTNSFPTSVYPAGISNGTWVDQAGVLAPDGATAKAFIPTVTNAMHTVPSSSVVDISALAVGATTEIELSAFTRDRDTYRPYFVLVATDGIAPKYLLGQATGVNGALGSLSIGTGWSATSSRVQLLKNGWRRVSMKGTYTKQTGDTQLFGSFQVWNGAGQQTYAGDGTSGIYLWGQQIGTPDQSYVPTNGSAVTRAADSPTIAGAGFTSWYRQDEGTFLVSARRHGANSVSAPLLFSVGGAYDDSMYMSKSVSGLTMVTSVRKGAATLSSSGLGSMVADTLFKATTAYKLNDLASVLNAGAVTTDDTVEIPTVYVLAMGRSSWSVANHWNGHIARLAYYPQRLSNTELQELTGA